jgi:hypothetical protein
MYYIGGYKKGGFLHMDFKIKIILVIIIIAIASVSSAGLLRWHEIILKDPISAESPPGGPDGDGFISSEGNYFISSEGNYFTSN